MTREAARAEARRLVVQEQATLASAAEAVGVPTSTVQKWSARERWSQAKETDATYLATVRALKQRMAADLAAATTIDPQKIFALKQLEQAFPEHRYGPKGDDPTLRMDVAASVLEQLVAFLAEHDRVTLTALRPHLAPFALALEAAWAA